MAEKLPSGSWRASVFIGYDEQGRRQYKRFTAPTKQGADLLALQFKAEHKQDRHTGTSFALAARNFMDINSHTLSPATLRGYNNILKGLNGTDIYMAPLSSIDYKLVQNVINKLSASKSPKTVRNYHGFISAVLKSNGISMPECNLPQKQRPDYHIPDEATLQKVFEAAKGTEWEIPVLLGAIGPMRRGEIVAATLSDLEGDVLHVHSAAVVDKDNKVVEKDPKTIGSDRYIQLPHQIAEQIRQQGFICNISIKTFSKDFRRFLEKNDLPVFRFHDLRHAFVSISHAAGIADAYIMSRGGWSSSYTVNNVYRHILDKDRQKAEATVNNVFTGLL